MSARGLSRLRLLRICLASASAAPVTVHVFTTTSPASAGSLAALTTGRSAPARLAESNWLSLHPSVVI